MRSMKHLDEKWPQRAKVELIQTWKNHLWISQFQPNFQGSSEFYWKIIVGSLKGVAFFIWTPAHFPLVVPIIMNNPVCPSILEFMQYILETPESNHVLSVCVMQVLLLGSAILLKSPQRTELRDWLAAKILIYSFITSHII